MPLIAFLSWDKNVITILFTLFMSVQISAQKEIATTFIEKDIIDLAIKGKKKEIDKYLKEFEKNITGENTGRKIALKLKEMSMSLNDKELPEASIVLSKITVAYAIAKLGERDTVVGLAYDYIGNNFLQLGYPDSALYYYEKAAKNLKDNNVPSQYAFSLIGKAVSHYYLGEIMEMENPLKQAMEISYTGAKNNEILKGFCFQLSGVLYDAIGDYDKAIELNKEAIAINLSKPVPDSNKLAIDYNNLGAAYFTKGDYDLTNEFLEKSFQISQKLKLVDEGMLGTLVNLIFSYSRKNEIQNAKKYLKFGEYYLKKYPALKNTFSYISFLNAACYLHLDENDFERAIYKANLMLSRLNPSDVDYLYLANLHLGHSYLLAEDFQSSEKYLNRAIGVFEKNKEKIFEGKNLGYTYLAQLFLEKKEYEQALVECQSGLSILLNDSTLLGHRKNPEKIFSHRYTLLFELIKIKAKAAKNLFTDSKDIQFKKLAHETYQLGIEVLDSMRNESVTSGSKQFLLKETIPYYENAIANAVELYKISDELKYIQEAFKFAQKGKAILLLERIGQSKAKIFADIPDSVLQQEKHLKQDLSFYQKQLFDESQFGESADSLKLNIWKEKVFDLKRSLEDFNEFLKKNYPRYASIEKQSELPSVSKIQDELLSEEELFVEYFVGENKIFSFVISKNKYDVFATDFIQPVKQHIEGLFREIADPPAGSEQQALSDFSFPARKLYKILIDPFAEWLEGMEKLLIVSHDWLSFIPFEILLTNDESNSSFSNLPYLFKKFSINYAPAASLYFNADKSTKGTNNKLIAFAPAYHNVGNGQSGIMRNGQSELPGAQRELVMVKKYFSGDFYFNEEATEERFKNEAGNFDLIHLAMHGSSNTDAPLFAKLDFTENGRAIEDGQLHAYEIYQLRLKSKLVVLSACESGFGKFVHGEGVMSLAQAFLQVGAQSVTMSLWEAQDDATEFIMGEYYEGLSDGMPKDEALRNAKLKYLKDPIHQMHPFFWSSFVGIGDPSPIVAGNTFWVWGIVGLLGIGLIYAFFRSKSK